MKSGDAMEKKGMSEARKRANKKWNDANLKLRYDRIGIVVPKGRKSTIEARASAIGKSINNYVNGLIQDDLSLTDDEWKNPDQN